MITNTLLVDATNVVRFPGPKVAFEACEISAQFLKRYDAERALVVIVEAILSKNSEQLKTAMQTSATELSLAELADEIRMAANGFRSLSEAFDFAADRIEVVGAKVV